MQNDNITGAHCFTSFTLRTLLLCELMQQAAFADSHIADYDVLEDIRIIIRSGRHDEYWKRGKRGRGKVLCIYFKINRNFKQFH